MESMAEVVASTIRVTVSTYSHVYFGVALSIFNSVPPMSADGGFLPDRSRSPWVLSLMAPKMSSAVRHLIPVDLLGEISLPAFNLPAVTAALFATRPPWGVVGERGANVVYPSRVLEYLYFLKGCFFAIMMSTLQTCLVQRYMYSTVETLCGYKHTRFPGT